jgi:hypothetical protein
MFTDRLWKRHGHLWDASSCMGARRLRFDASHYDRYLLRCNPTVLLRIVVFGTLRSEEDQLDSSCVEINTDCGQSCKVVHA